MQSNHRFSPNVYSFDQFDLKFNRPDVILQKLIDVNFKLQTKEKIQNNIKYLLKFAEKRAKLNGLPAINAERNTLDKGVRISVEIRKQMNQILEINIKQTNKDKKIIGYKIFINGVPIYGNYIKKTYPNSEDQINTSEFEIVESVTLSPGQNKIETSAFTEDGIESPRESISITYTPPTHRKPNLYFVGIGIDDYNVSSTGGLDALTYAVKDSKELATAFASVGKKSFGKVYTKLLTDKEVSQESIQTLREFLSHSQVDDHVILFLSGHGIRKDTKVQDLLIAFGDKIPEHYKLRDKSDIDDVYYYMTSNSHVDRPWEKAIPLDSIRNLVNGIPSRQKIMFVDTCQSGEKLDLDEQAIVSLSRNVEIRKTRGKKAQTRGIKLVTIGNSLENQENMEQHIFQSAVKANAQKEMSELFPELRRGTGTIEISAATGVQSALESSEWKNGAFTYVIKEAILKGKAKDKNGNITAQSLRSYVLDEVERLTDGQQTPMVTRDIAGRDFVIFGK